MTVRGIVLTVIEAFLLAAALGTGIREIYIFLTALGTVLILALLSVILAAVSLSVKGGTEHDSLPRLKEFVYTLTVRGTVILPIVCFVHICPPGNDPYRPDLYERHSMLLSFGTRDRIYRFPLCAIHKGYFKMQPDNLFIKDLFGLFVLPVIRKGTATVPVEVSPVKFFPDTEEELTVTANGYANALINPTENGESLSDTRTYREGDPLKRINWKQSIRARELYTRLYEEQENPEVVMIIDGGATTGKLLDIGDMTAEIAFSIAEYFVYIGKDIKISAYRSEKNGSENSCTVSGKDGLIKAGEMLTELCINRCKSPLEIEDITDYDQLNAAVIFVISECPSQNLAEGLNKFITEGRKVVLISPRIEAEELPDVLKNPSGALTPVVIFDSKEIPKKVGESI